ncbi:MAG: right-handed parallel beta-helix repeat-containing protein [Planctomycetota bacterium]
MPLGDSAKTPKAWLAEAVSTSPPGSTLLLPPPPAAGYWDMSDPTIDVNVTVPGLTIKSLRRTAPAHLRGAVGDDGRAVNVFENVLFEVSDRSESFSGPYLENLVIDGFAFGVEWFPNVRFTPDGAIRLPPGGSVDGAGVRDCDFINNVTAIRAAGVWRDFRIVGNHFERNDRNLSLAGMAAGGTERARNLILAHNTVFALEPGEATRDGSHNIGVFVQGVEGGAIFGNTITGFGLHEDDAGGTPVGLMLLDNRGGTFGPWPVVHHNAFIDNQKAILLEVRRGGVFTGDSIIARNSIRVQSSDLLDDPVVGVSAIREANGAMFLLNRFRGTDIDYQFGPDTFGLTAVVKPRTVVDDASPSNEVIERGRRR